MKKGKGLARRRVRWGLAIVAAAAALGWGTLHYRYAALARAIEDLRRAAPEIEAVGDLRGIIHVHTSAGGDSQGTLDEVVAAARRVRADFVILTEHPRPRDYRWSAESEPGKRPILIFGEEREEETRRVLVVPYPKGDVALRVESHWMAAPREALMEIVNLHEEADAVPRWKAALWLAGSLPGFSRLALLPLQHVFREKLQLWDEVLRQRRLWIVGGNDAHASIGARLEYSSGDAILDWTLDSYEDVFGYVSTHVWLREQMADSRAVLDALASGHSYVAFDFMHDPSGFSFKAGDSWARTVPGGADLFVQTPLPARIRLIRNGVVVKESENTTRLGAEDVESGVYRVEVYLPQLGAWARSNPWILSNPIFVGEERKAREGN